MRKYFIEGVELKKRKVSQNDKGRYYFSNVRGYWGTTIDKFDNAIPPKPYQIYINGTHGMPNVEGINIKKQKAYDYPAPKDTAITCSEDVLMEYRTSAQGSFCIVTSGAKVLGVPRWKDFLVHTYKWARQGAVVKAGKPICYIKTNHLHIFTQRFGIPYPIRKVILAKD